MLNPADDNGHVLYPRFGSDRFDDQYSVAESVLKDLDQGIDAMSAKLVLMDRYETMYNIFDHKRYGHTRPLGVVAMHAKEDASSYSKLYRTIWRYSQHRIHEQFGLSLGDFLDLPHDIVELLFKISTETSRKKDPELDNLKRDIEKMQKS